MPSPSPVETIRAAKYASVPLKNGDESSNNESSSASLNGNKYPPTNQASSPLNGTPSGGPDDAENQNKLPPINTNPKTNGHQETLIFSSGAQRRLIDTESLESSPTNNNTNNPPPATFEARAATKSHS